MFNWLKKSQVVKSLGQRGEEAAQAHYKAEGFSLLEANYFNKKGKRLGEVDFIVKNKTAIVFVEVKTRTQEKGRFGSGAEAVNGFKQIKLLKAVKTYLGGHPEFTNLQPRIDVCEVVMGELDKVPKHVKILVNAVDDWN